MAEAMIYKAMLGVMEDIGVIKKEQENIGYKKDSGYKFRGIDQLYNALQPALIKHGVIPCPCVIKEEREQKPSSSGGILLYSRLLVQYRFYAQDGSFIECTVAGEAMDSGDKATNKAMTAAYKYACFQVFCIPTDEMEDSEKDTYEIVATSALAQQATEIQKSSLTQEIKVTEAHVKGILKLAQQKGCTEDSLKKWMHVKKLDEMTMEKYRYAVKKLTGLRDKETDNG